MRGGRGVCFVEKAHIDDSMHKGNGVLAIYLLLQTPKTEAFKDCGIRHVAPRSEKAVSNSIYFSRSYPSKYTSHISPVAPVFPQAHCRIFPMYVVNLVTQSLQHSAHRALPLSHTKYVVGMTVAFQFEDPKTCPPAKSLHLLTSLGTSPAFRRGIFSLIARAKRSAVWNV